MPKSNKQTKEKKKNVKSNPKKEPKLKKKPKPKKEPKPKVKHAKKEVKKPKTKPPSEKPLTKTKIKIVHPQILVRGIQIPDPEPPEDMYTVMSGLSFGKFVANEKPTETPSGYMRAFFGSGKKIISGIRINGVVMLNTFIIQSSKNIAESFLNRNLDGIYVGNQVIVQCNPADDVFIDHIYAEIGSGSAVAMINYF